MVNGLMVLLRMRQSARPGPLVSKRGSEALEEPEGKPAIRRFILYCPVEWGDS